MKMRIAIVWLAFSASWSFAEVVSVVNVPGDYSTIQQAIQNTPDGCTIIVAPGTYFESLSALDLGKNLYIKSASGAAQTRIDGGNANTLLRIDSSTGDPWKNLTFDGFTFRNGRGTAALSPVTIDDAKPQFLNCVFTNNTATEKAGAVLVYGLNADALFVNCVFVNNRSDRLGGAVVVDTKCHATFKQCTFSKNSNRTANALWSNEGGALILSNVDANFLDCLFEGNSTAYAGGAVMILQKDWAQAAITVRFSGCRFMGNFCQEMAGKPPLGPTEGGAILAEDRVNLEITNCTFSGNTAATGGAVHSYRANARIWNSVFDSNLASGTNLQGFGGAIGLNNNDSDGGPNRPEATLQIYNCMFRNCTGPAGGAILFSGDSVYGNKGVMSISDSVIEGCTASKANNSYGNAGAMFLDRAICSATNLYVLNNHSENHGGGFAIVQGTELYLYDSLVAGNEADGADDAIHDPDSSFYAVANTLFAYNGGSPSANAVYFMAAPPVILGGEAYMGYFVAPFNDAPSISPQVGTLPDRGGFAAGSAKASGLTGRTTFSLESRHPTQQVMVGNDFSRTYGGSVTTIPARIEAERFDYGGEQLAYHDTTIPNEGGALRVSDRVDISTSGAASGGYLVGWIQPGEWMDYTINVTESLHHDLVARTASVGGGGRFYVQVDGVDVTGVLSAPDTGGWTTWADVAKSAIYLTAGPHVMRFVVVSGNFSLDCFDWRVTPNDPIIAVSPTSAVCYVKEGRTRTQTFEIWNAGIGSLPYTLSATQPWLTVNPTNGNSSGEHDTVTLTYSGTNMPVGVYTDVITVVGVDATNSPLLIQVTMNVVSNRFAKNDFDGDTRSDIGYYYAPGGNWNLSKSVEGIWQTQFGYSGTVPVTGDFDGDGLGDFGCYYAPGGNWYLFRSKTGFWQTTFGYLGTVPVTGDFDGDGKSDFGCYYAPGGNWYFFGSKRGFWQTQFGYLGTVPVVGDFDGDGTCDFGCYYAPGGNWYFYGSKRGFWQTTFGYAGTVPVVGDFDGDGKADFGCYYAPGGNWYFFKSKEGFWQTTFGYAGTVPVTGDFDGDGRDDFGCYSATARKWYLYRSKSGYWETVFGAASTVPLP